MLKRYKELKAKEEAGTITEDEKTELETIEAADEDGDDEEVVEVDEDVVKAISKKFEKKAESIIEKAVEKATTKMVEVAEKNITKNVNGGDQATEEAGESKELRFTKAAIALVTGDQEALTAYNQKSIESLQKAGYASTGTNADGGYIVADPEFEAEVEKLAEVYGVAFRDADVRPISRNSIKTNKRGSNVIMYETGEGVAKTGTKLVIDQITVELRKFAAIAVATDELVEDAAIDFWQEVAQGFAEERARIADVLVFTDTNATYPGILRTPGVAVETVGASISSMTWDDLMNAEVAVPTQAMQNGKHYMHRTIWNIVRKNKGSDGHYLLMPAAGLITPWGTPVVLVDVLPSASSVGDANEPYTVFGDLKRVKLYIKKGLVLTPSKDATVHDSLGNVVNLYEQDMSALRAVTRMVALVKFPNAFCVIGTGTVS